MAPDEIRGPDLAGVVADADVVGLDHVVIGGFAVIAHGYLRATKDPDLLVPDGREADAAILRLSRESMRGVSATARCWPKLTSPVEATSASRAATG